MLPVEILDHILSFLDRTSLEAYLGAYPAFSGLVERHLYAHITVYKSPNSNGYAPSEVAWLLSDNPHIANHVHGLCIMDMSSAPTESQMLALILPKFKNLQSITWHWCIMSESYTQDQRLCEAFINCLRLPSMVGVELVYAINFPLSAFVDCTGLRKLTLDNSICCPSSNPSLPYLKTLSIKNCDNGLRDIVSWAKTLELQSLDFRPWEPDDWRLFPQFLQGCTNSLTSLELGFGYSPDKTNTTFPFSLESVPHLKQLIIHNSVVNCDSGVDTAISLPVITTLVRSASSLKHLILYLYLSVYPACFFSDVYWSPLNLLFSNSSPPSLQRIDLRISNKSNFSSAEIFPYLADDVNLRELKRRGVLVISEEDIDRHDSQLSW